MQRKRDHGRDRDRDRVHGRDGDPRRTDDRAAAARRRSSRDEVRTEDIHIRSYDHRWSYDLDVEVLTGDGDRVFEKRYYVPPGQTAGELDVLPSGEYEISVTVDNDRSERVRCRIGASPDHTAVIEVGNGVLSVTEGLRA